MINNTMLILFLKKSCSGAFIRVACVAGGQRGRRRENEKRLPGIMCPNGHTIGFHKQTQRNRA